MKARRSARIQTLATFAAIWSGWKTLKVDGFVRSAAANPWQNAKLRAEKDSEPSLDSIERVFCLSDLHTDHMVNLEWMQEKCAMESAPGPNDLVVVSGDISHDMKRFRETIEVLQSTGSLVFFVPGNHESWLSYPGPEASSFEKLDLVYATCRKLGVLVDNLLIGSSSPNPLWVVPLQSWYDGSLSIEGCDDLCIDFRYWPWTDFQRCEWVNFVSEPIDAANARIPIGLAEHFHQINEKHLNAVRASIAEDPSVGLLTTSHFLPNQRCLPDWKDPGATSFHRDDWLDHGAPGTSSKFAKVAGSQGLDDQLRSLSPKTGKHIHVFGHSHRPKDFEFDGVRYVHNPLGKKGERDMYMVSPHVDFQLVWDTRIGEVRGNQTMRLWEEQGGGLDALQRRWALHGRKRQGPLNARSGQRLL
jgi:hypothetical protein